jgi:hypothetical protein
MKQTRIIRSRSLSVERLEARLQLDGCPPAEIVHYPLYTGVAEREIANLSWTLGEDDKLTLVTLDANIRRSFLDFSIDFAENYVAEGMGMVELDVSFLDAKDMSASESAFYHDRLSTVLIRRRVDGSSCTERQTFYFTRMLYLPAVPMIGSVPFANSDSTVVFPPVQTLSAQSIVMGKVMTSRTPLTLRFSENDSFNYVVSGAGKLTVLIMPLSFELSGEYSHTAEVVASGEIVGRIEFVTPVYHPPSVWFDEPALLGAINHVYDRTGNSTVSESELGSLLSTIEQYPNISNGFDRAESETEADIVVSVYYCKEATERAAFTNTQIFEGQFLNYAMTTWQSPDLPSGYRTELAFYWMSRFVAGYRRDLAANGSQIWFHPGVTAKILAELDSSLSGLLFGRVSNLNAIAKIIAHEIGHAQGFVGHTVQPGVADPFVPQDIMTQGIDYMEDGLLGAHVSRPFLRMVQGETWSISSLTAVLDAANAKFPRMDQLNFDEHLTDWMNGTPPPPTEVFDPRTCRTNVYLPSDVNDDGKASPIDALIIINLLNREGVINLRESVPDDLQAFVDTNGDMLVNPIDALIVINYLNRQSESEGEQSVTLQDFNPFVGGPPLNSLLRLLTEDDERIRSGCFGHFDDAVLR